MRSHARDSGLVAHVHSLIHLLLTLLILVVLAMILSYALSANTDAFSGGNAVKWEGWTFNWKILQRQGVVLTHITFQGRSVLKYAGIAEVFVPYNSGEPRPEDQRFHPFGENLIPLIPGEDCL